MAASIFTERERQHRAQEDQELLATLDEIIDARRDEFLRIFEGGEVSVQELQALKLGLDVLEEATESPEALAEYIRTYVLRIDVEKLKEHGFDLDTKGSVKAQTKEAKKKIKDIQAQIENLREVISEIESSVILTSEMGEGRDFASDFGSREESFRAQLKELDLPENVRESFLGRALEARKKAEEEIERLTLPEERLKQAMDAMFDQIKGLSESFLLSAEITGGRPIYRGTQMSELFRASDAPMAQLIENPTIRERLEGLVDYNKFYQYLLESGELDLIKQKYGERDAELAAKAIVAAAVVVSVVAVAMGAGIPGALTAAAASGGAAAPLIVGGALYSAANAASVAFIAWANPIARMSEKLFADIRTNITSYQQALDTVVLEKPKEVTEEVAVEKREAKAPPQKTPARTSDTARLDAQRRAQQAQAAKRQQGGRTM